MSRGILFSHTCSFLRLKCSFASSWSLFLILVSIRTSFSTLGGAPFRSPNMHIHIYASKDSNVNAYLDFPFLHSFPFFQSCQHLFRFILLFVLRFGIPTVVLYISASKDSNVSAFLVFAVLSAVLMFLVLIEYHSFLFAPVDLDRLARRVLVMLP